jgi:acyl carrier protein
MDDPIEAILKEYILTEHLYMEKNRSLSNDESLLSRGVIDSIGLLQMVAFVEEQFKIKITPDDLVPENFETVNALKALIQSKGSGNG